MVAHLAYVTGPQGLSTAARRQCALKTVQSWAVVLPLLPVRLGFASSNGLWRADRALLRACALSEPALARLDKHSIVCSQSIARRAELKQR